MLMLNHTWSTLARTKVAWISTSGGSSQALGLLGKDITHEIQAFSRCQMSYRGTWYASYVYRWHLNTSSAISAIAIFCSHAAYLQSTSILCSHRRWQTRLWEALAIHGHDVRGLRFCQPSYVTFKMADEDVNPHLNKAEFPVSRTTLTFDRFRSILTAIRRLIIASSFLQALNVGAAAP